MHIVDTLRFSNMICDVQSQPGWPCCEDENVSSMRWRSSTATLNSCVARGAELFAMSSQQVAIPQILHHQHTASPSKA